MDAPQSEHPIDEKLHAFSLGMTGQLEQQQIAAHLNECARCCAALERFADSDGLLGRLRSAVAAEPASREGDSDRELAVRALKRGRWREFSTIGEPRQSGTSRGVPGGFEPTEIPAAWQVGAYEIIAEIGRGGMGVVFKARHRGLNRLVALKMILAAEFASKSEQHRFQREAELAARVKHVNIVQVHEVGQLGDRPYISMEWVSGGTLAERLDGTPWSAHDAARLIGTLALAIDAAHRQGVIHRDLKPANILVQPDDEGGPPSTLTAASKSGPVAGLTPKITDFGLARTLQDHPALTKTGFAVGTPEYMAPEQADGDPARVGPVVDVYALGVILYQLLTGQPPYRGESPAAVLLAAASDSPVAPRRIKPNVPRDLETIVLKAIEREPKARYLTAAALGEDLRRFLADEPILARPPRLSERLVKWARRQPRLAGLAASLILVTVAALAGLTALWLRAQQHGTAARRALYRADIAAAASGLQLNRTETARRLLESSPIEHRDWEWRYLKSQLDNSRAVFRPGDAPPHLVAVSPDCGRVVYAPAHESTLHLHDVALERDIAVLSGHEGEILSVAWSRDGSRVASSSADGTIRLWEGSTGRPLTVLSGHAKPVIMIYLSADGSRLAAQTSDSEVRVWDVALGVPIATLSDAQDLGIAGLSPSGKRFAVGQRGRVRLWDTDTGSEIASLLCGASRVLTLAFSPDGKRVAAGTEYPENRVWIWDMATGGAVTAMEGHTNAISSLEFSPDGSRIVSASHDGTLRLWDCARGTLVNILRGHSDKVIGAHFHPDGRRIASASLDGTLRLWDTHERELVCVFRGQASVAEFVISSPDGAVLAGVGSDGVVRFWDVASVKHEGVLGQHAGFVYDVAFSPSGETVASAGWDGTVRLWNPRTAGSVGVLRHPNAIVTLAKFHPDGRRLVSACRPSRVCTWDLATERMLADMELTGGEYTEQRVAFAAGGALAASTGGRDFSVRLFAPSGGVPDVDLPELGGGTKDVAFSPDGNQLLSGHADGTVRVLDVARRSTLGVLRGHEKPVCRVAFSPDGRKIATSSEDMTARLWDASTYSKLAALKHHGVVYAIAFNPEGSRLATGCDDNIVHLWDTESFDEVIELPGHTSYVHSVAFSPDGSMLVSGSGDFSVRIWDSRAPDQRRASADRAKHESVSSRFTSSRTP
jgi:WD40 repeat protein/serine/threonine protein kinase